MGAIADVIPVLPVSLVSAVFLEAPTTDLDILEIEQRANKLINELQKNKAPVLESPRSTRMAAIADAIELMQLRGLIAHRTAGTWPQRRRRRSCAIMPMPSPTG
jgi:ABC-type uncharacterized transport system ATPase subunit